MGRTCYCSCAHPGDFHSLLENQRSPFRESQDKQARGTLKRAFRDGCPASLHVRRLVNRANATLRWATPTFAASINDESEDNSKSIDGSAESRYGLLQKNG